MNFFDRLSRRFRSRRMQRFVRDFGITSQTRVLDIGGTFYNWSLAPAMPRLTIVNLPRAREEGPADWVNADGCALPFRDGAFDVVFSNSVIEHLGTWARQCQFASEMMRVGKRYFVQTPNKWFPVETHLLTPFVHWLPKKWQAPIVRRWTVWGMVTGITGERNRFYIEHYLADIRLLDARAMRELFSGAQVRRERFLGFTKSLIAARC